MERHHGVLGLEFPVNEYREAEKSNNEWCDNVCFLPQGRTTAGEGEGDEEASECCDEENDSNNIELPEKRGENRPTMAFEGGHIVLQETGAFRFPLSMIECSQKGYTADCGFLNVSLSEEFILWV